MNDYEKATALRDRLHSIWDTFATLTLSPEEILRKCKGDDLEFFYAKICEGRNQDEYEAESFKDHGAGA